MRVLSNLRELEISLNDWERYQRYSLEDLKKDLDKRNMTLHAMLVSFQSALDISSYLISENGLKRPATYRETFDLLGQAGTISEELAAELSASEKKIASPASVSIGAEIADAESRQIKALIKAGVFLNESDFVRDAIRHRLAEIKVIKCWDVDYETAKKEVTDTSSKQVKHIRMKRRRIWSLTSIW